jgi:excisionase family DNA binding protein
VSGALLSVDAAAAELSVNPFTLRRWIARGRLPSVRLGRCVRVKRADLERLIEANTRDAHPDLAMDGVEPDDDETGTP